MYPVPQMAPISDLKHRHLDVFKRLKQGPVILANRSQPAAVLISPERWNAIIEYIDDLECGIEALQTELAIAKGDDEFERLTPTEIEEWLGDNEIPLTPNPLSPNPPSLTYDYSCAIIPHVQR